MSLRRRLLWSASALLVLIAVAFAGVVLAQRAYLIGQLDDRLTSFTGNPKALIGIANRAELGTAVAGDLLSDSYVGVQRADGRLRTVLAPQSRPQLEPVLLGNETGAGPVTRLAAGDPGTRIRLVEVPLATRALVIGLPMDGIEAAVQRLIIALTITWLAVAGVAALVGFWLNRLGLAPIAELTRAADKVTASGGRELVQVTPGDPSTEAGRLAAAFNQMTATTASGQEQLRRFVADASHELRTPLTTLRGYSSLYAQGGLATDDQVADAMARINAEATRMGGIVDDLLELTTLGDGATLALRPVDLGALLGGLAADLRVREPDREVVAEGASAVLVRADPDRLSQALTALLANAVKYSADGTSITLTVQPTASAVRIWVVDQGVGIAAEELPRVFDRFYRVRRTSAARGSGLGLAIVAAIISAHQGRYGVESEPGVGSRFWIELPRA
ncbi:two-component system OmpR family sensor kinase [Propionicimonas paludicola]|uniref:Sensor-like histidine kinase SenX3 n=1 Tax=Propionicimonas paludicola TaxID=185243 RepID=A0A2A9CTN3_9ACTN|nr:HAMP domain-containing sensor histidine kinase [Propionicimonas paludicola]PFG17728.1 two-component system OmpR family sensor kinase [Propionicimonas paludicola]